MELKFATLYLPSYPGRDVKICDSIMKSSVISATHFSELKSKIEERKARSRDHWPRLCRAAARPALQRAEIPRHRFRHRSSAKYPRSTMAGPTSSASPPPRSSKPRKPGLHRHFRLRAASPRWTPSSSASLLRSTNITSPISATSPTPLTPSRRTCAPDNWWFSRARPIPAPPKKC